MKVFVFFILVGFAANAQVVEVGDGHVVMKCSNGRVYVTGNNDFGQQGNGTLGGPNIFGFTLLRNIDSIEAIAAGGGHTLILRKNGSVLSWGANYSGQLAIGNYSLKLLPFLIDSLNSVISISAGRYHSLFLEHDSTIWGSGENIYGELGQAPPPNSTSSPILINGINSIVAIEAGNGTSLALDKVGNLYAWGANYWGQLGIGSTQNKATPTLVSGLSNVIDFSAETTSYAVTSDGKVWGWGRNKYGELGNAVPRNNNPQTTPVQIPGINNVVQVEAGFRYALALRKDGTVRAWGRNAFYELGDSTTTNRYTPVQVKNLKHIHSISANVGAAYAIDSMGVIYSWGTSPLGALASGNDTVKPVPTPVPFSACNPVISLPEISKAAAEEVQLYPNPSAGRIYFKNEVEIEKAVLYNANGQSLKQFNRPSYFDISERPSGLYFFHLKIGNEWVVYKIFKDDNRP